uniref:non-specific serine/threonine protein kinase n=1 Tax=Cucumis melo TaxID=3656 RepID=A0A9I9DXB4_CUCME
MEFNGSIYEGDDTQGGKASFFISSQKWGYASTGVSFLSDKLPFKLSSTSNSSFSSSPTLYSTARVSPLSLNYYGFCLISGSYYVKLHFTEILFTADQTYASLRRRIFDISIQGKLIKDFNIMEEAGGVDFHVKTNVQTRRLPAGAIAGRVVVGIFIFVVLVFVLRRKGYLGGRETEDDDKSKQPPTTLTLQIKLGREALVLSTRFSIVKGVLSDGTSIAVKQLSSKSRQGNREFITEVGMTSGLQHPNLNNNLARALFSLEKHCLHLDWPIRMKICVGIAKGLAYLHEESRLKIVHRDTKATNVLLDENLNAKISDFGLAKLHEEAYVLQEGNLLELVDLNLGPHYSRGYEDAPYRSHMHKLVSKSQTIHVFVWLACLKVKLWLKYQTSRATRLKSNTAERDARFKAFDKKLSRDSMTSISTLSQLQGIDSSSSSTQNKDDAREYSTTISLFSDSFK